MEWPLALASAAFFALYAFIVIEQPSGAADVVAGAGMLVIWAIFVVDLVVRLVLAPDRWQWLLRNLHLVAVVVLPFFRTLFLLRVVAMLGALQRATGAAFRGRVVLYGSVSAVLVVLTASLGVLDAEQDAPGASITTFGDALWWACTTLTTVGYGDLYPVTVSGRLIAVALMLSGIGLVGVVTATFASSFVERLRVAREHELESRSGSAQTPDAV